MLSIECAAASIHADSTACGVKPSNERLNQDTLDVTSLPRFISWQSAGRLCLSRRFGLTSYWGPTLPRKDFGTTNDETVHESAESRAHSDQNINNAIVSQSLEVRTLDLRPAYYLQARQ